MKAEIIETKKNFEPIEIKLVIESEEELCSLWHRLNVGKRGFTKDVYNGGNSLKHEINIDDSTCFWYKINDIIKEKELAI